MNGRIVVAGLVILLLFTSGVVFADVDGDGLTVATELQAGTDPLTADTDGDGLSDGQERDLGSDPLSRDTDSDGVSDATEHDIGTRLTDPDTDGDGLSDKREHDRRLDPNAVDTDDDGLNDKREVKGPTKPTVADTDGDGLSDGEEIEVGSDPTKVDTDGDGLADETELDEGSDPTKVDTDTDGLDDKQELELGTDPTESDTDGDGLGDQWEYDHDYPITEADADGDGLNDSEERKAGTDPRTADTDGDGFTDGTETNANELPNSDPTMKDIYVEVDVVSGADANLAFGDIKDAYEEHGFNVHFIVDETELSGSSTITIGSWSEEKGTYSYHYNTNFDNRSTGYHYLLIAPEIEKDQSVTQSDGGRVVGISMPGMMLIQSDSNRPQEVIVMHELGHSLGLNSDEFEGIDSDQYSMYEYKSVLNYNVDEYIGYSTGSPFDDWAWLKKNMFTPPRWGLA